MDDFKASGYGIEYVSLTQGERVLIACDVAENQGYSFGRTETEEEGWFPTTFVEMVSELPTDSHASSVNVLLAMVLPCRTKLRLLSTCGIPNVRVIIQMQRTLG